MKADERRLTKIIRPLRSGQITIPVEFRKELGITEESLLQVSLEGQELRIRPVEVRETGQGSPWLREVYALFAPTREEIIKAGYTEDEVNAIIDEAIAEVRNQHA